MDHKDFIKLIKFRDAEAKRQELYEEHPFPRNFYPIFFDNFISVISELEVQITNILKEYQWNDLSLSQSEYTRLKELYFSLNGLVE